MPTFSLSSFTFREICFPGGARDPGETALENAVRETSEELCLAPDRIHVIAQMDTMLTAYNNEVSVFLCELEGYEMTYSKAEVGELFTVPLRYFLDHPPASYQIDVTETPQEDFPYDRVPGGRNYYWRQGSRKVYFYDDYKGNTIWGLTAYIMQSVAKILHNEAGNEIQKVREGSC